MSRHEETCPHCRAKAGLDEASEASAREPIRLPEIPTPIRVHTPGRAPFDCTLHPDGTLTAVLGGELRRNAFTFAEMLATSWADSHIEFNPTPLAEEPVAGQAAPVVQEAIAL